MAARKSPKSKQASSTGAADAAQSDLQAVQGRDFAMPDGYVICRVEQHLNATDGQEVTRGRVVIVPEVKAAAIESAGWVSIIQEPTMDCTMRELLALDGGSVPIFE